MERTVNTTLHINNVPIYAYNTDYSHWVIRLTDSELWFYGAYNDNESAKNAAEAIKNGFVIDNPVILDK